MSLGVTVVVCTYNGAALLPETIKHIAQQRVHSGISWEVIIVDNASTDNTSNVILEEWKKHQNPAPFRLLHQPRQGLTYARELALTNSHYAFVLFCDDDNWLDPDYVNLSYDLMLQNPSVGVLGGYGELVYEVSPPSWATALPLFANGPQAKESGKVRRNAVYGAGCVLRKSAYKVIYKAGFKPMLTDRVGSNLSSGGDYELCYAIALAGYDIWYDERLKFKHFMPDGRISWNYYVRYFKEAAQCFEVLLPYQLLLNHGSKNTVSFSLKLFMMLLLYILKKLPVLFASVTTSSGTEEAKLNTLKFMGFKGRLLSFTRYRAMKRNFKAILKFKQEKLSVASKLNSAQANTYAMAG
ncbi:glycosyltransferase [Pontibacter pamirensis]|uniref:glycosyltransferase n=1 Tax=Pontibacter pamirensis TaxID=2562824 RepID=UPI00138A1AC2|nr:glycosyltransferase [Pontibacter pamirensis]